MNFDLLYDHFEQLGYEPHVFYHADSAVTFLKQYAAGKTVGFGGSMTCKELDLYQVLKDTAKALYWHWETPGEETLRQAMTADLYLCSANAVTQDGMIVNLDGNGNRIAGTIFGPKEVVFVIGRNKIVPTLQDAYERIRNVAAPKNAKRLGKSTPCAQTGHCVNCKRPDSFCCVLSVHMRKPASIKGTVLLIDEDLGY